MSDEQRPDGFPPPPAHPTQNPAQQPAWEDLPPATTSQEADAAGHAAGWGATSAAAPPQSSQWGNPGATEGAWGTPAAGQPGWGAAAGQGGGGAQGWGGAQPPPPGAQGWGGGQALPPPAGRPKGTAPIWVVVLVGILAFVIGGAIGGFFGFIGGTAVGAGGFVTGSVGPDALGVEIPAESRQAELGQFTVSDIEIGSDFANDFEAYLTITNNGGTYDGGLMEIIIWQGGSELGSMRGHVDRLSTGASTEVHLFGFDDYRSGYDTIELRIDRP